MQKVVLDIKFFLISPTCTKKLKSLIGTTLFYAGGTFSLKANCKDVFLVHSYQVSYIAQEEIHFYSSQISSGMLHETFRAL